MPNLPENMPENRDDPFFTSVGIVPIMAQQIVLNQIACGGIPMSEPAYSEGTCHGCGLLCTPENMAERDFRYAEGRLWCGSCYRTMFFTCEDCGEVISRNNAPRMGELGDHCLCWPCIENTGEITETCESCGNVFFNEEEAWEEGSDGRCRRCSRGRVSIEYRNAEFSDKLLTKKKAEIMLSTRPVGIELEVEYKDKAEAAKLVAELPREIGTGTDRSIQGMGMELRFAPAVGGNLEQLAYESCKLLKAHKFDVNPSCGFHVHLDLEDLVRKNPQDQLNALKMVWSAYLAFEDVIASFLPQTRRPDGENGMKYCQSLRSEYSIGEVMKCINRDELERLWYRVRDTRTLNIAKGEDHHPTRYRGVNFHPYWREGHMEIRYHTGTIRPEKILEWANLHARLVDKAMELHMHDSVMQWLRQTCNSMDLAMKTNRLFDLCALSEKSRGYFAARQEKFREVVKKNKEDESFKSGMKLLTEEKEI